MPLLPISKNASDENFRFVFAITENPPLGFMIEPFAVREIGQGQFSYDFQRINQHTAADYFPDMSPDQKWLMEIYSQYDDEAVLKRFNKDKLKPALFFESLKPDFVLDHIRPVIDGQMAKMADVMLASNIPVYFKGHKKERIQEQPIRIASGLAETVFHFCRNETGVQYRLLITHNGNDISLTGKETLLLGQSPCLLIIGCTLYRFGKGWDGKKLTPFFTKDHIVVPKTAEKAYFQKFVLEAVRQYNVKAEGFDVEIIEANPKTIIKLEQNWLNHWSLQVSFDYGRVSFPYGDGAASKVFMKEENGTFSFVKVQRDAWFEGQAIEQLEELGLINRFGDGFYLWFPARMPEQADGEPTLAGHFDYLDWLTTVSDKLGLNNAMVQHHNELATYLLGQPGISLSSTDRTDWFDLYGTVCFGSHEIPFMRLRNHILQGKREFVLPDGTVGLIPAEWFVKYHEVLKYSTPKGNTLQVKRFHYTLLEEIKEANVPLEGLVAAIRQFKAPPLPEGILANLRPYQLQGFNWMNFLFHNRLGGCLADDMGLGKTLQTLAMLLYAHKVANGNSDQINFQNQTKVENEVKSLQRELFAEANLEASPAASGTSLLVMPLSLIHNWMHEIRRFTPSLRAHQHTGVARSTSTSQFKHYDLVLTTYGTVRNDIDMLREYHFNYVVLDESQIIKNAESKIFNAIKELKASHRLVLTGTPIENSLNDLWAQFSFLNPGMLGSKSNFRDEFVNPIEKNNNVRNQQKLHKLIEPFILRRTKAEVARELPELTETVRYCEMTDEHSRFYQERKSQIRNMILEHLEKQGVDKSRFFILSSLMKLRLIANHPFMVDPDYAHESGKFSEVRENISKLMAEGHKVLIFSQFVKHLNIYRQHFETENLPYNLLTGQVTGKDRERYIHDFQNDPQKRLFLISLKAGGVGLNLTGADYVFMLDPWWNPAAEKQAINRAHRIGQDKRVFVYKFITRETIEEKILLLQEHKNILASMYIDRNNPLNNLGEAEIRELIS